ncbi:tetratricopeptide repeat protein [Magnetospirillum aberrantis]|uniref:protein O-GlcNAc transferase n=1 Tax=Magnetospirillum aberrantis SpK TaxID=908842 RepID=A0A7C9UUM7_9PROT|nr:tetratricopeptide repeat protein [Magnetospirillum aberrantis]NFV78852.1 tetratricopeptide repeat protein [Magnetospirillum aberrantis SpK]
MNQDFLASSMAQARQRTLGVLDLIRAVDQVRGSHGAGAVVALYDCWVEHNGDDPLLYAVLFNLSVTLSDCGEIERAVQCLERALEINPDFTPASINLGRLLERKGGAEAAVRQWAAAVDRLAAVTGTAISHKITALNQIARVMEDAGQDDAAENMLRQSLDLTPDQPEALQHFIALRQRQCEWPVLTPWDRVSHKTLVSGMSPLSMGAYADDPVLHLAAAWNYNRRDVGLPGDGLIRSYWAAREGAPGGRLRIGYLSSDLREHAVGYLCAELFELHDKAAVEVFAYYTGIPGSDPLKERFQNAVDHWIDVTGLSDAEAARRIADDGIHILVDLNGYTRDGRTKLVALRPAPVIVNWLGYPGTTGSPYHHYIIADDWIIPEGDEVFYSEKVLRLPCYQPNDRKRAVAAIAPTRAEMGLPDDAMVYCCFNGLHKVNRFTFQRWLDILRRVPGSVLWLMSGTEGAQTRLREAAVQGGIDPQRLVFAGKLANPHHLARYPLADLFLDTSPYGAHTTASDALWMGVPMLTLSGRSFASRVCGSLVRAAGLPDLVCTSAQEYVDRAVALGREPSRLAAYRQRLSEHGALFDMDTLVRRLEQLYRQMWDEFQAGTLPRPDLRNLETYMEIGTELDFDAIDPLNGHDPVAWWRDRLAIRHQLRPIPADARLWNGGTEE